MTQHAKNVYIISDLHLAEGNQGNGIYLGTENFFADLPFESFINHLLDNDSNQSSLLINGDFVDFIRITHIPEGNDYSIWQSELKKAGKEYSIEDLQESVSKKEKKYGLKTHDFKCVWKLHKAIAGHAPVFTALAKWVDNGNELVITKGNHDIEWHWILLQDYLKFNLFDLSEHQLKKSDFDQNISFKDSARINDIHIEHGHRFEKMTRVKGNATLDPEGRPKELRMPMGSFFNRYLINKVEMYYPFVDNYKGGEKFAKIFFREKFTTALKLLLDSGSYLFYILLKFKRKSLVELLLHFLSKGIPAILLAYALQQFIQSSDVLNRWLALLSLGPISVNILFNFLFRIFGYNDKGLKDNAYDLAKQNPEVNIVVLGHNHNPEYDIRKGIHYINSGTWIPTHEVNQSIIRNSPLYTVIRIRTNETKSVCELLNWNPNTHCLEIFPSFKKT